MSVSRRRLLALGVAVPACSALAPGAAWAAAPDPASAPSASSAPPERRVGDRPGVRVNLAHLDFLRDTVRPAPVPGHDTYRLREEPALGALWTYAERQSDGSYRRTGGGERDPETGHYAQGAYNADDMARAAVVYLRHWRLTGSPHSERAARQLLRGVCYLQTTTGPHAGDVVLWQQADGTLNRSAYPPETPDPSDSGPSYWLARLVWALGEGVEAFGGAGGGSGLGGPEGELAHGFVQFLRDRLELALTALERDVLSRYGTWETADGRRVPAWLIARGADATSEAVLGLAAYVRAGGGERARRATARFAEGIAALASGGPGVWPYGAVLPYAASLSQWHAWGAQMPTALAVASQVLGREDLLRTALGDAAGLTPELLTAGGCDNGRLPAPVDRSQIAYGVDSRLRALLTVAEAAGTHTANAAGPTGSRGRRGAPGLYPLAALTAAWYFGANAAGEPVHDPDTGVTFDGVSPEGGINRNSGAESTVHGLLSMLALASLTDGAVRAGSVPPLAVTSAEHDGTRVLEAEDGELTGAAKVQRPDPAATEESAYSGDACAALREGGAITWTLPSEAPGPLLASPVVNLVEDRAAGRTVWNSRGATAGSASLDHGTAGPQGVSAVPGTLTPVALPGTFAPGGRLRARAADVGKHALRVDAVLVRPAVARLVVASPYGGLALLHNGDGRERPATVTVPGSGRTTVELYDVHARPAGRRATATGREVHVAVPAHGFAVLRREGRDGA
ncbi:hypothetical protein [Streptomyces sp. Amel2xB2]|uniref:hypothetical protein n=1 Tax=Streptomyces sp. Amel2xB2 TaxID=1305829 RepID=UPI000DBA7771|nr:hypothetical protein [Streptomyces sp. Amel2xB2]